MKKIVFTGGGTAGHIMPNLALIDELPDYKIYYIGSNGMEKNILSKYKNITYIEVPVVKFYRSLTPKNLLIPFKLMGSIKKTKKILKEISPNLIFSKGGYVSIPTSFAGHSLNIPIITHESDLSVGLANKLIAKKSKHLCCSFKSTADNYKKNAVFTGSPIRKRILQGNSDIIFNRHKLQRSNPTILIVGGSQGAKAINETIFNGIDKLTKKYNIIHIVGKNNKNNNLSHPNYIQIEFANDIENYFSASDIVITRAGSNTIFELLALCKPMILIPLPKTSHSRGDQVDNARYFEENKFSITINQDDLTLDKLLDTIEKTIKNKQEYINTMKKSKNIIGNKTIIDLINKTCI